MQRSHMCPKESKFPKNCAFCETQFEKFEKEVDDLKDQMIGISEEVLQKTEIYFHKTTDFLEDTAQDFNARLHVAIENGKFDIDLRIESLKTKLETIRESMFLNLDEQKKVLLSNIAAIDTNKLKNEFKELFPLKSTDQLDKFMQTMKSSLNKAQEYLDLLYKIEFTANEDDNLADQIGSMSLSINKYMSDTEWSYFNEEYAPFKLKCKNRFEDSERLTDIVYLGEDLLAILLLEGNVKIWNIKTSELIRVLNLNSTCIHALPGNKLVANNKENSSLCVWDLNANVFETTPTKETVTSMEYLSNNLLVVANMSLKNERMVPMLTFRRLNRLTISMVHSIEDAHKHRISCLLGLPEDLLASGSFDKLIKIWNCKDFSLLRTFEGHICGIFDLKFLSARKFISCSGDGAIKIWNYETGECQSFSLEHYFAESINVLNENLCVLTFVTDSLRNEVYEKTYSFKLFEIDKLKCFPLLSIEKLFGNQKEYVMNLMFLGDQTFAAAYGQTLKIFDFKGN